MELNNIEKLAEYGAALGASHQVNRDAKPYITTPPGWNVTDLEGHLPKPLRKRGNLALTSASSFVDYVKRHADPETTVLLADETSSKFRVIFNHHSDTEAGWGDHTATYNCPLSPEWKIWTAANKVQSGQEEFALFIENNNLDITDPDPATMLEVSRTLQAKKKVDFSSGIRLDNGQNQFTYNEEIVGTAGGKGQFNIPEQFVITIPVHSGGPGYRITARLRYRIKEGKLVMWYDLLRPHKYLEDAFKGVQKEIEEGADLPILAVTLV